MSAAEKLRALEPVHLTVKAGAEDPYAVGAITLYNVPLPQIVAVVEAAETDLRDGGRANARALAAALAALDEALSPKMIYTDASGEPFDPQPIREALS